MLGHPDHDAAETQRRIWKAAHPELAPAIDVVKDRARGLGYLDGVPGVADPGDPRKYPYVTWYDRDDDIARGFHAFWTHSTTVSFERKADRGTLLAVGGHEPLNGALQTFRWAATTPAEAETAAKAMKAVKR